MAETASAFTPLPLRARNILELLDTSLKVYKQYFWVLLGWSALVNILGIFASSACGGLGSLLFTPVFLGVAACCVAAAVRGQNVTFKQCWQFAQARFGGMLGWYLLTMLISFTVLLIVGVVTFGGGAYLLASISSSSSTTMGVIGISYFVIVSLIVSVLGVGLFTWAHLAPLVVCMEENNPDKNILKRSWDLMQGQWVRATSLMTMLTLAAFALLVIIWAAGALMMGLDAVQQAFSGTYSPSFWLILGIMISSYGLVFTLFTPAFLLAMVLFYLDLRVRKEALDLEWTTHATAPTVAPMAYASGGYAPANASVANAPTATSFENLTPLPADSPAASSPIAPLQPIQLPPQPISVPPAPPLLPNITPTAPATTLSGSDLQTSAAETYSSLAPVGAKPTIETAVSWQSLIEEPAPAAISSSAATVSEITCPACGKKSPSNYIFCMSCGQPLPGDSGNGPTVNGPSIDASSNSKAAPDDSAKPPKW